MARTCTVPDGHCPAHGTYPRAGSSVHCPPCTDTMHRDMLTRVLAGQTCKAVGEHYGYSHERVRQIVTALEPAATTISRAIRREQRILRDEAAEQKRLATLPPCQICFGPVPVERRTGEGRQPTCSARCALLRRRARFWLDPTVRERHRIQVAWSRLTNDRTNRRWRRSAARTIAGIAEPRTFVRPWGEVTWAAVREVARLRGITVDDLLGPIPEEAPAGVVERPDRDVPTPAGPSPDTAKEHAS